MKYYTLTYAHKTANGNWIVREYTPKDRADYERVVKVIHENKDEYKVVKLTQTKQNNADKLTN